MSSVQWFKADTKIVGDTHKLDTSVPAFKTERNNLSCSVSERDENSKVLNRIVMLSFIQCVLKRQKSNVFAEENPPVRYSFSNYLLLSFLSSFLFSLYCD